MNTSYTLDNNDPPNKISTDNPDQPNTTTTSGDKGTTRRGNKISNNFTPLTSEVDNSNLKYEEIKTGKNETHK